MAAIVTDNLVEEFLLNTKEIFDGNYKSLNIKEVYENDVLLVPVMPSVALACPSFYADSRTLGTTQVRYTFNFIGNIWFYFSTINQDLDINLIMKHAYKIADHVIKNGSLNGWLTNKRATVRSCNFIPRRRGTSIVAAARIVYVAEYLTQLNIV